MPGMGQPGGEIDEKASPLSERFLSQIPTVQGEEIEGHQFRGGFFGELVDPGGCRVETLLQNVELCDVVHDHDDLTVDHGSGRELGQC